MISRVAFDNQLDTVLPCISFEVRPLKIEQQPF